MVKIDIEMPRSCEVCPFVLETATFVIGKPKYQYCDFPQLGEFKLDGIAARPERCPLIEVLEDDCK